VSTAGRRQTEKKIRIKNRGKGGINHRRAFNNRTSPCAQKRERNDEDEEKTKEKEKNKKRNTRITEEEENARALAHTSENHFHLL